MFEYTENNIEALKTTISVDRLSTYLQTTENNEEKALKLYLWNTRISATFYIPLQGLEICLRNTLHTALSEKYDEEWYNYINFLDNRAYELIDSAKKQVKRLHEEVNAPHVVAELSFGFWLSLLNKQYHQSLWIPCFGRKFSNARKPRAKIHRELDHLRILRNRVAHHEPIFTRHLEKDYKSITRTIGWMCETTSKWVDENNSVIDILNERP